MVESLEKDNVVKKPGRPKKTPAFDTDTEVNETSVIRLEMEQKEKEDKITIDQLNAQWKRVYTNMAAGSESGFLLPVMDKWNRLNPFLQNQRVKNIYTQAKEFGKADISSFLANPGNSEKPLRALSWANSSSQQIYYNILRRSCDIPLYNYYVIPDLLDSDAMYKKDEFKNEDAFVHNWLETFNIKNTFKTIALEVKREGKSSYLLRNKVTGTGKGKTTNFCSLQKMPTDWVKITGKGMLGYTISFNMMYFMNMANSPVFFGEFIEAAWADMLTNGIVTQNLNEAGVLSNYSFDPENIWITDDDGNMKEYSFLYQGKEYKPVIESISTKDGRNKKVQSYLFWLQLPYDICYTFGSDNSHPWMAPDTMGLMLKMQELTDYCQLAGLIASTPLTAVLTGEIEPIAQPRAGKNESVFAPEVIQGMQDKFNSITSTNVEAFLWPAKNIKLQQLSTDVNSSEIISSATANFLESAGEGGLTIATDKPNVAQITVAKQLAASQQNYVTLQFEHVINFILQHKIGLKYRWKIHIWGDIFNIDNDKGWLKEIVANGNVALLPKLMSAEGISMRDTKALTDYIKSLDFYKDFMTYTQLKMAELSLKAAEVGMENKAKISESDSASGSTKKVGRPSIADSNIENDATAKSREQGTNTTDNREQG